MLNHRKLLLGTHSDATIANAYKTALQGSVVLVGPSSVCAEGMCWGSIAEVLEMGVWICDGI